MDPENDATNQGAADDAVHVNAEAGVDNTDDQNLDNAADDGLDPEAGNQGAPEDEFEEIEHEGKAYKVPKALKPALMFNADYTRKTQELAEQRRAFDAERQAHAQRAEVEREARKEIARAEQIDERITQLKAERPEHLKTINELRNVDWDAWAASNPTQAQADWDRFQQARQAVEDYAVNLASLESDRDALAMSLKAKQDEWTSKARAEHANALEKAHQELARDIPGWSPQVAEKLTTFGQTLGFSAEELSGITDPRAIKVLHAAWKGAEALKTRAAADKLERDQKTQPATQVGGRAPNARRTTDSSGDGLSTDEWMRRERERVASKGRR